MWGCECLSSLHVPGGNEKRGHGDMAQTGPKEAIEGIPVKFKAVVTALWTRR